MTPKMPEPRQWDACGQPTYTQNQMLAMYKQGLLRAAEIVEEVGPKEGPLVLVTKGFADAIRKEAQE